MCLLIFFFLVLRIDVWWALQISWSIERSEQTVGISSVVTAGATETVASERKITNKIILVMCNCKFIFI
jgi:hypothetical protein